MTQRLKTVLLCLLGLLAMLCLAAGAYALTDLQAEAEESAAKNVAYGTVAVHDPSVVLAYEDGNGNTYPTKQGGGVKVYYVFGTNCAIAKSYDLINWANVSSNVNDESKLYSLIRNGNQNVLTYTGNDASSILGNSWAPDVIYNTTMNKWCMYLSVNGATYNSVIVMLTADKLDGDWAYAGEVVWSGMGYGSNQTNLTDFSTVTGISGTVPARYSANRNDTLIYGLNAIDACVLYDNGTLWMTYGSWFGGIYMLKLDGSTGLRDANTTYRTLIVDGDGNPDENADITNSAVYTVYSDAYFGIHIAGGHGQTGEGSYIQKIGNYFYLFMSYGGYAPDGDYNMRLFRSATITGFAGNDFSSVDNFSGYTDGSATAMVRNSSITNGTSNGKTGIRLMTGYTWSWWNFSYVSQGHNSAFVDDDGNAYLIYHNKFMDGTAFHVMKVHRLYVTTDEWLAVSPFEATATDEVATGLSASDIEGTYGYLYMTRNNGGYGSPVTETVATFSYTETSGGLLKGGVSNLIGVNTDQKDGTWTYDPETGVFTVTATKDRYTFTGYLLRQNLEGTTIRTLVFTAVSTTGSHYTYWGYRYPSEEVQKEYLLSSNPLPGKADSSKVTLSLSSDLWDKVTVSADSVPDSDFIAEYGSLSAGQTLPAIDASEGIMISFDYSGYSSDWTTIIKGENFSVNLSVLVYGTTDIYEADASGVGNYQSFYTTETARATVVFKTDGSILFYRDGALMLTYAAATKFNDKATTVSAVCAAILKEFEAGTVSVSYALSDVVIDTQNGQVNARTTLDAIDEPDDDAIDEPADDGENGSKVELKWILIGVGAAVAVIAVIAVAVVVAKKKK